jgi:hypothetical protein
VAATENLRALQYLRVKIDDFPQWATTVAFYTALHVIEAVFAHDNRHTDDHAQRNRLLKTNQRYRHLWQHYRPLWNDSLIARYLKCDETPTTVELFSNYMLPADVEAYHIRHNLHQIILSARRLMNDDEFMKDAATA